MTDRFKSILEDALESPPSVVERPKDISIVDNVYCDMCSECSDNVIKIPSLRWLEEAFKGKHQGKFTSDSIYVCQKCQHEYVLWVRPDGGVRWIMAKDI